jgi:hypothetical protein
MSDTDTSKTIADTIQLYIETSGKELEERWKSWAIDATKIEVHEVIGALLARQTTLATQFIRVPEIWNGHIAPLFLRAMVDNYINLAWIFISPDKRAKEFIEYGLGQAKLCIEHRKQALRDGGVDDVDNDPFIKSQERWVNSQRFTFLTTVNVGSWSEKNMRDMAEEAGCLDLYRYAYAPFSAGVHNQWNHIARYNLVMCRNPLHRRHRIPCNPDLYIDMDYAYRAAKYLEKSFKLFDTKLDIEVRVPSAFKLLKEAFDKLPKEETED